MNNKGFTSIFLLLVLVIVFLGVALYYFGGGTNITTIGSFGPAGKISASPKPCIISPGSGNCTSYISWSTSRVRNACVYIRETGQLFGCGLSGLRQKADFIGESGFNFELRTNRAANFFSSKIVSVTLSTVLVKGQRF
ncbi:MAG: hypothetical protein Q8L47_04115 [bacterium]|nr:hypothetical protein [bacterium]